jgi:acetyl-CoA carboxylase carboxyltransferase component/biotin carboxyl carrier protein
MTADAPARRSSAPTTDRIEVPTLVDRQGRAWVLPAVRTIPVGGGDLIETISLDPSLAEAMTAAARAAGPGAHALTVAAGAVPGPMVDPLDGWALAQELLGIDLPARPGAAPGAAPLADERPAPVGHAIEARLRAPEAPDGARLLYLRQPHGPGIRVVEHAAVGSEVGSNSAIRIIAHGSDRAAALARLRHALAECALVIEGSASNRCALLETVSGLSRSTPTPPPGSEAVAVLVAAIRASAAQRASQRSAFHARAARGRPEPVPEGGASTTLVYGGASYQAVVHESGPDTYRIAVDGQVAELTVERRTEFSWLVTCAGQHHQVLVWAHATGSLLEVDGVAHRVDLDEGVAVRAGWPALVVSVAVAPDDAVEVGDPLVVVEAMKMESTIRATFAGTVTSVDVLPNEQVDAGAVLAVIRPPAATTVPSAPAGGGERISFAGMALADTTAATPFERVYSSLRSYLLGYELDPGTLTSLLNEQRSFSSRDSAADRALLTAEDVFLDLFTEVGLLWQVDASQTGGVTNAREYLLGYLQWLDPDRVGMPEVVRRRLIRALSRYGVTDLYRNPALESAVVRLFTAQSRLTRLAPVVAGILERRLKFRDRILPLMDRSARNRYDRITAATQGHLEAVADLSRDNRFRFVDEPAVEVARAQMQARMEQHLDALVTDPLGPDREERIAALVACPLPLRAAILRRRLANADRDLQATLLEIRARRWYRIRDLRDVRTFEVGATVLCSADYDYEGRAIHVVLAFTPVDRIAEAGEAIAEHLSTVDPRRSAVIDLMTWRSAAAPNGDALAADLAERLSQWTLDRPLWRLDVTVSSLAPDVDADDRTQYVTFRGSPEGLVEDRFYRNLHPMLAKRLELWRLGNFDLTRLPSQEDVYLFHGVARDNPKDHRLFALAEVRDMTAVPEAGGGTGTYPILERLGLQAIIAMRQARATFPDRGKPQNNRITLFVRPPWDVPEAHWPDLAELMVPLAGGAGLELMVIRTQVREPDGTLQPTVFNVDGIIQRSVTISQEPPRDDLVRPLTRYRQKVLTAQRFGVPYPFEILRMFAPPPGTMGKFRPAHFVEHDLDETGEVLVPVERDAGLNTANVVVGLLTTFTDAYPEGMTRVALLSDPTRGLGNLAEPECRRINAALALAAERKLPVEWFAVSSGALISMESGTENMDWIALTLRRIIEFTQGGGEINIIVTGINVGGQPYWNAEATMLLHTKGILVMIPTSAMVLTGKQALDFSGGVSADDNFGIGGYDRVMGPNGQAQYFAGSLADACELLLHHYDHTYVAPGERFPRRVKTDDPFDRDVRSFPHAAIPESDFTVVGDVFSNERNPERKKPFDVRSVMRSVTDQDFEPLERWERWRGAENSVVWDARIGGHAVCLLGLESRPIPRRGYVPADGPASWTSGTLFPQASRKTARAVNAATGNRPLVVLANLSGFDGSPESMRHWQLEYGAEIGRAVTNFRGPIIFVVISRYHGGAFVVFSKALNSSMEVAAVEGSFASVIGGAPAAATVFAREVRGKVDKDPRVQAAREQLVGRSGAEAAELRARLAEITEQVRSEKLGEQAGEFDSVHTINRALEMGSVDEIITAERLRPWVIEALDRGIAREEGRQ